MLGKENTYSSSASETAPAQTSRASYATSVQKYNLRVEGHLRLFRDPFQLKTSFGLFFGLESNSDSSASETAPARTSRAPYATCVRKHNRRVDTHFRLFRDPFRLKTGFGLILGLENTSGSSASERAAARTSRAPYAACLRKHNLRGDAHLRLFRDPFRLKTGFGLILGLENTSVSSASETAPARTSRAPYETCVRKHNLRVDAHFLLFRDLFRLKIGFGLILGL